MSKKRIKMIEDKLLIGRYEWCGFEDLHIPAIRAKIDTGAKTSAIHAFNVQPFTRKQKDYVRFDVHPIQGNDDIVVGCKALIVDERTIKSSNGEKEKRYVISTILKLADQSWDVELTLSNRDLMQFRLLLGREAMNRRVLIDPNLTYNQLKMKKQSAITLYE